MSDEKETTPLTEGSGEDSKDEEQNQTEEAEKTEGEEKVEPNIEEGDTERSNTDDNAANDNEKEDTQEQNNEQADEEVPKETEVDKSIEGICKRLENINLSVLEETKQMQEIQMKDGKGGENLQSIVDDLKTTSSAYTELMDQMKVDIHTVCFFMTY